MPPPPLEERSPPRPPTLKLSLTGQMGLAKADVRRTNGIVPLQTALVTALIGTSLVRPTFRTAYRTMRRDDPMGPLVVVSSLKRRRVGG